MKILDEQGLQYLWKQISLEDYPNNETLIAVLNAIDETKADKDEAKPTDLVVNITAGFVAGKGIVYSCDTPFVDMWAAYESGGNVMFYIDGIHTSNVEFLIARADDAKSIHLAYINGSVYLEYTINEDDTVTWKSDSLITRTNLEETTGIDTAAVMSQKAVTDALALKADQTSLDEVSTLVGDTAVADQISEAIAEIPQSDWNQNDKNKESYIKNKPFYDSRETIVETENISLSFDGNLEGKESIDVSGNGSAFVIKISDTPLSKEQFIGGTMIVNDSVDGLINGELSEDIIDISNDGAFLGTEGGEITSVFETTDVMPLDIGVWFLYVPNDFYISSFTNTITTEIAVGELKKIDEKFLPKEYATVDEVSNDLVNICNDINTKMNKNNPVGTGSFSMNRKAGTAVGNYSHAEGNNTTASGNYSHAEGSDTIASGEYSHAEGYKTIASGSYSHAEGSDTTASGIYSHAEGDNTIASGKNQHVQGKYNIDDASNTYAHIVGNGTFNTARSNAHTLDWSGNAWFQGEVKIGGTGQDDENAKTLMTTDDIITIEQIDAICNADETTVLVNAEILSEATDSEGNVYTDNEDNTYVF